MDDSNQPPPIPDRPGRAQRIQGIETLKPESKLNDYVDIHTAPKLPPRLPKSEKQSHSFNPKVNYTKGIEQSENVTNEHREQLQAYKQKQSDCNPVLPPRRTRAPPLPPRARTLHVNSSVASPNGLQCKPAAATLPKVEQSSFKCNPMVERHRAKPNSTKLQPSVLIISEQSSFPSFRSNRRDKTSKDLLTSSSTTQPVVQQPQASNVTLTLESTGGINNTIICRECGQCRCSDCTGDRKLPERWLCEGNCRCSADSVVDAVTCMYCVKSCFKGCIDNPDGPRVDPCACTNTPKCLVRWTALAALSLCLPCLCCYWPLQGGIKATTACYNSSCCRRRGCICEKD